MRVDPSGGVHDRPQRRVGTVVRHHVEDVVVLVTTSGFTPPALEFAHERGVRTVDGAAVEWDRRGYAPFP
ncbi:MULTISPECIES: restriction endonuclease [unclassified Streptomyces]|uniref:restriction endonuclease n=1 Tax=unclassified Streptomyces TaxID=2593676 RepID=UPI0038237303